MMLWTNLKVVKNFIQKQELVSPSHETLCEICYHLYTLKYVKNTYGGVLLLIELQDLAFNFTKSNSPPQVFFTFFK